MLPIYFESVTTMTAINQILSAQHFTYISHLVPPTLGKCIAITFLQVRKTSAAHIQVSKAHVLT